MNAAAGSALKAAARTKADSPLGNRGISEGDRAQAGFRRSLQQPGHGLHFSLAMAYEKLPDVDREIGELQKFIAADPNSANAEAAMGKALVSKKSYAAAIAHLRKAVRLDPKEGSAHYQLGLALRGTGNRSEAAAEFALASKINAETALKTADEPQSR